MKARTKEFAGDGFDGFRLVGQEMADGARLLREKVENAAAAKAAAEAQAELNLDAEVTP